MSDPFSTYYFLVSAKSKMWAEVVQYFTESESSVRSEIREIDGEDYQVWKLVGPTSPCVSRIE